MAGRKAQVTPAEVRAVWESLDNPNPHKVSRMFRQAGKVVHQNTVKKFFDNNWLDAAKTEKAEKDLDDAVAILTGNPLSKLRDVVDLPEPKLFGDVSNADLTEESGRNFHIAAIRLNQILQHLKSESILRYADKVAILMGAAANGVTVGNSTLLVAAELRQREMKTVGGAEDDVFDARDHPLADALNALSKPLTNGNGAHK